MRELSHPIDHSISVLAFSPDGRTLHAGSRERVRIWDVPSGRSRGELPAANVLGLTVSSDGRYLAVSSFFAAYLFDLSDGHALAGPNLPEGDGFRELGEWALAGFLGEGDFAVYTDGEFLVWPIRPDGSGLGPGPRVEVLPAGEVHGLAVGGGWLAGGRLSGDNHAIDFFGPDGSRTGELAYPNRADSLCLAAAPDGRTLALAVRVEDRSRVQLHGLTDFDPDESRNAYLGMPGRVDGMAFSPDGRLLAAALNAGPVVLWETRSGRELARYDWGLDEATCIAFAPDGLTLAVGGHINTAGRVVLWDVDAWGR